jgi:hypothetical protein
MYGGFFAAVQKKDFQLQRGNLQRSECHNRAAVSWPGERRDTMALGKQIGEFSVQLISTTWGPGSGKAIKAQANMEGTGSGERGEVAVSLTHCAEVEPGAKSGTWSQYGVASFQDGTWVGFHGEGTWEEIGSSKWRYRGSGQTSEGQTYATEFEGDATTRTWAGKLYEWS